MLMIMFLFIILTECVLKKKQNEFPSKLQILTMETSYKMHK